VVADVPVALTVAAVADVAVEVKDAAVAAVAKDGFVH
jgi:hypothetical protein